MKLYRGDNINNDQTNPGLYRGDGLHTKTFGKGNPAYIEKHGLLTSVRQHIAPITYEDKSYYNLTDFISFSKSRDRALYWGSSRNKFQLIPCKEAYQETRYLFTFEINEEVLDNKGDGIFMYEYNCNTKLRNGNSPIAIETWMLQNTGCETCNNIGHHSLILINSATFLSNNKHLQACDKAIEFATADNEWLILPKDPLGKSKYSSARIPRADCWNAELYTTPGESRDPYKHAMLGQTFEQ